MIFNLFGKKYGRKLRDRLLEKDVLEVTPSLVVTAHHKGRKILHEQYGDEYAFYDWASITKIVFLAGVWIRTMQTHAAEANDPVSMYWPEFKHKQITLAELFTHTSGLPWWNSYYKKLLKVPYGLRQEALEKLLLKEKIKKSKTAVYSDVDMLVAGVALQHLHEKSWLQIWDEYASDFPRWQAHYSLVRRELYFPKEQYAPTEKKDFRKKIIQGEVHDPNTWSFGGVAPHAGIFGRIEDLDLWMLTLRRAWMGDEKTPFGDPKVVREFTMRHTPRSQGDFGYMFMKPSKPTSSAGSHFSADSFGHLGFTGTSTWFDPKRDLLVSILSNRLLKGPDQSGIRQLRPKIHNLIVEVLES